jgi:hypothetical protein
MNPVFCVCGFPGVCVWRVSSLDTWHLVCENCLKDVFLDYGEGQIQVRPIMAHPFSLTTAGGAGRVVSVTGDHSQTTGVRGGAGASVASGEAPDWPGVGRLREKA